MNGWTSVSAWPATRSIASRSSSRSGSEQACVSYALAEIAGLTTNRAQPSRGVFSSPRLDGRPGEVRGRHRGPAARGEVGKVPLGQIPSPGRRRIPPGEPRRVESIEPRHELGVAAVVVPARTNHDAVEP